MNNQNASLLSEPKGYIFLFRTLPLLKKPTENQELLRAIEQLMPGKKYRNKGKAPANFFLVVVNLILLPEITCLPLFLCTTTANNVTSSTVISFPNRNMVNSLSSTAPCCLASLQVYAREWNWNCNLIGLLDCQRQLRLQIDSAGSLLGIYNKYSPCLRNPCQTLGQILPAATICTKQEEKQTKKGKRGRGYLLPLLQKYAK